MSEVSADSGLANLTEEQKEFLQQCEEDFANRFTNSDEDFIKVRDGKKSLPPIEDSWNPIPFRDRDSYRDRDRGRYRDYRDRDRDRDGWRNRYGGHDHHSRYDNRRRDNYNRYNRSSPYQSNYYRK